jgi:putative transposase
MDRYASRGTEHRTAMSIDAHVAVGVVLHPGRGERRESESDAFAGREVPEDSVFRSPAHDRLVGQARSRGQCQAGAPADADHGLGSDLPKPRLSIPGLGHKIYPYLLRDLQIDRPNQVWASDITYIRLRQGFIYLVAIMDWFSRYVVAWEVSVSMDTSFCLAALDWALQGGRPEIFNTDQGSQFTSEDFTNRLKGNGIEVSMDGRGRVIDNIFIERLWRTVKYEEVYLKDYLNVGEAISNLKSYFWFYNHERSHQALGYRTPATVHAAG